MLMLISSMYELSAARSYKRRWYKKEKIRLLVTTM